MIHHSLKVSASGESSALPPIFENNVLLPLSGIAGCTIDFLADVPADTTKVRKVHHNDIFTLL